MSLDSAGTAPRCGPRKAPAARPPCRGMTRPGQMVLRRPLTLRPAVWPRVPPGRMPGVVPHGEYDPQHGP
jgi:hypothetical protein